MTDAEQNSRSGGLGLRVFLLGPLAVEVDGCEVAQALWVRRKSKLLVALLALRAGHRAHREEIMEALWPEQSSESAVNSLHKTIHAARRALAAAPPSPQASKLVVVREQWVSLEAPGGVWVDATELDQLAADALRDADTVSAEAAIALYRGDLLADAPYEEWAAVERERFRAVRRALGLGLADMYGRAGRHADAQRAASDLVRLDPTDEESHRRVMAARLAAGEPVLAIRQFELCEAALRAELDVAPEPATVALRDRAVREAAGPMPRSMRAANNIPHPATRFVGRVGEIASVGRLLGERRLVTLTGMGGIGKTRLALEVARAASGSGAWDGVWLVELAEIRAGENVPNAVATAAGVAEERGRPLAATLADSLRDRRTLLVLDNCEHVLDACAEIAGMLLAACPALRILATSREALGASGEAVWRVETLAAPGRASAPGRGGESDAVDLLVDRIALADPAFELTPENAALAADLCLRLEGIPLAIELAAARAGVLGLGEILDRLTDRFALLASTGRAVAARHRALRATLDWSYEQLVPAERALLATLSVFAGGWGLAEADALANDTGPLVNLLGSLADKSFVLADRRGAISRYRMLDTIREYAAERLAASGEADAAREAHARLYARIAREAEPELLTPRVADLIARLEIDHENLRAALGWCVEHDPETAARAAGGLLRFWLVRGHITEGRSWLDRAAARCPPSPALGKCLGGAGFFAWLRGDYATGKAHYEAGMRLADEIGDRPSLAYALSGLGSVAMTERDYEAARALFERSLAVGRELGAHRFVSVPLNNLGVVAQAQGDFAAARAYYEGALEAEEATGNAQGIANVLGNLGQVAADEGDDRAACGYYERCLRYCAPLGNHVNVALSCIGLARIALRRGAAETAAFLLGAADGLCETVGYRMDPDERRERDAAGDAAREALGAPLFSAAVEAGRAASIEDAVARALEVACADPLLASGRKLEESPDMLGQ